MSESRVSANDRRDDTTPADAGTPHPRRYLVLMVVGIALLMASVDQTIVSTALPAIQHDLHARLNWSSWTITIYALGQILVMPLAGRLSDQYGRKTIFLTAVVLFTSASLLCGLSNDIYLLVALRAVQAIGGGAFMPSAVGIVSDFFGRDRDRAIGLFTSIIPIGALIGPILGGVFVTYWSWRGIFLVNVPLGIALLILGLILLPAPVARPAQRIDVSGIGLLVCGLLGGMFAVSTLATPHFRWWSVIVAALLSGTAFTAFIRHSRHDPESVIPIRLLRGNGIGLMHLVNFASGAAALGFGALMPLYAQNRYHLTALSSGTLLTARAIGTISVAGVTAFVLRRTGYRKPMAVGFGALAVGLILIAIPAPDGMSPYAWLAIGAAVTGLGMGVSIPATNNAALHLMPQNAAAMSGIRGMFRQAGGITGISVVSAFAAQSAHPGTVQAISFVVFAVSVLLLVPFLARVPDHRGSW